MTERADAFSGPGCVCTRAWRVDTVNLFDKNQVADVLAEFVCPTFLRRFARESCIKVAIHVRGGVWKFTHVVENDTTVHDVHTYTVAFSPSVLIKCSICPYHQTLTRTP